MGKQKVNFLKKGFIVVAALILLAGCTEKANDEQKNVNLKIGLMPAVDAAPILLAQEKGYFEELGLDLETTIFTNAVNRQTALQTGELDGTITDLIAFISNQHNGFETKIVTSTDVSFAFLVGKDFEATGKKKVGLMEVSVANYLADMYITPEYEIEKIFIPEIPTRLEMLNTGNLDMAFIPEPLASIGQLSGLEKNTSITADGEFSPDAIVFTADAISQKNTAISRFIEGYNRAVKEINKDESLARDILIEKINLKPEINELIDLPDYKLARIPSEDYLNSVIHWVEQVQNIDINLSYEDMVDRSFTQ